MPTEKEIEAEARKQCLRAFEPYTYGPYFEQRENRPANLENAQDKLTFSRSW